MLARCYLYLCFFCLISSFNGTSAREKRQYDKLSLGAVFDLASRAGREQKVAMDVAMESFYSNISNRPSLHVKDSKGEPVLAFRSAKILIKRHHVRAIIGLGRWEETILVADLCNKFEVPFLSLANDVPSWASQKWPFLIDAARSKVAQLRALATIIHSWRWRKVNVIYEDFMPASADGIISELLSAFREAESEISEFLPLPPVASYQTILENLEGLKRGQCRVFIVHSSMKLATNVFTAAKSLGMMEKDSVWITSNEITSSVDTLNSTVISSMQGVLGIKSYLSCKGRICEKFDSRFKSKSISEYPDEPYREPSTFALEAYDAAWAVALAMKGEAKGRQLLDKILRSDFEGLSGLIEFEDLALSPARVFKVINVVKSSYRELGYWSEGLGFSENISIGQNYSKSMNILGEVFWPGGLSSVPRGWAIAAKEKLLKIGVPSLATFKEFVRVRNDSAGGDPTAEGFSINVFKSAVALLPYDLKYALVPYEGSYDSLVEQVHLKVFDAVIGDINIVANRCNYVEFSQPYSELGMQMLTYVKTRNNRAWLFRKPFTSTMWIVTVFINIYNGFVVWLIERSHNPQLRGTLWNQVGTMLSLAFTTLFSQQGERLHSNLSRMAMVVWLFVALVITQSFTANLTTLLTVEQLDPPAVNEIAKVGCAGHSSVAKYLQEDLGFAPDNIIKFGAEDEFPQALRSGKIAAAFLEVPYIKLLLAKNCRGFKAYGPLYKVGGFGFAFPKSSPYIPDISKAILNISETGTLRNLEERMYASTICTGSGSGDDDPNSNSLGVSSFLGLYVITGGMSSVSLLLFFFRHINQRRNQSSETKRHRHAKDEKWIFFNRAQHHPGEDEKLMFDCEMKNQGHWP